jgi:hypothetical protein
LWQITRETRGKSYHAPGTACAAVRWAKSLSRISSLQFGERSIPDFSKGNFQRIAQINRAPLKTASSVPCETNPFQAFDLLRVVFSALQRIQHSVHFRTSHASACKRILEMESIVGFRYLPLLGRAK